MAITGAELLARMGRWLTPDERLELAQAAAKHAGVPVAWALSKLAADVQPRG